MLAILVKSGIDVPRQFPASGHPKQSKGGNLRIQAVVVSMAAAQVALAVLALTSYHVQIITRISSGYPVWYWWVAGLLRSRASWHLGKGIAAFMVVYAMVQGVLFASFLPPA